MKTPRLVAGLALLLAGGCIQFEEGPMTTTDTAEPPGSTTEDEEPPPEVTCDPLSQDCPDGQACAPVDDGFGCIDVTVDGAAGDVCLAAGECGPGLACVLAPALDGCDGASCCSELCEVSDAGALCGSSAEVCAPILAGDDVPAMWADWGVCQLP